MRLAIESAEQREPPMLRITEETLNGKAGRIRLEGQVVGPYVTEVRKSCEKLLNSRRSLALDMSDVSFVDRNGVTLFKELISRGVSIVNGSPFLTEQLKEDES
jgi:ABC-type transporter Mla MlaB component